MRASVRDKVDFEKDRVDLLEDLNEIVEGALSKFVRVRVNARDRTAWGRLAVNAIAEMNKIMKDMELDDLVRRVDALEALKD